MNERWHSPSVHAPDVMSREELYDSIRNQAQKDATHAMILLAVGAITTAVLVAVWLF